MFKSTALLSLTASLALIPAISQGTIHTTILSTSLTTAANPGGGNNDGTGVWFNPLTGYAESRGFLFPNPLFEDGKFFLLLDKSQTPAEAQIFTEGFFSRGNGVIYQSSLNLNPGRYGDGVSIGASTGFQSPGAGFPDLGPSFGNWVGGGHGFLGLTLRDPAGTTSSDIFYGYAEINVSTDYSITLLSFAYNDVRNAAITTVSTVPEPSALALAPLGFAAWTLVRRRRA